MMRLKLVVGLVVIVCAVGAGRSALASSIEDLPGRAQIPRPSQEPIGVCFPIGCDQGQANAGTSVLYRASGAGWSVSCAGRNDDAHFSSGPGGAIFKTKVTCTGHGVARVSIRYQGRLNFAPSAGCSTSSLAWRLRAQADYTQSVEVNGSARTFYTPRTGSGGRGTGWWGMSSTWYFVHDGVVSTTGSHHKYVCKGI